MWKVYHHFRGRAVTIRIAVDESVLTGSVQSAD
ncbi:hypothetical protein Godav_019142 [Gossypium davidsonii]|uniref:Uncharacterized protein n=1 Tax=Gossypium davidsonii TaxID=34287 RepID=A0A7J8QYR3_GOSDV|nr:hypothetical protein [Gossypium davidsonii]